jgi:hypothetical protein
MNLMDRYSFMPGAVPDPICLRHVDVGLQMQAEVGLRVDSDVLESAGPRYP